MSRKEKTPIEIYVRQQSGPSSLLTFHLNEEQRLQLISALATGEGVELSAQLELSVLPQWVKNSGVGGAHAVIPLHWIGFNVDPAR